MSSEISVVCAWCGVLLRTGNGAQISHGLCARCAGNSGFFETEDLHELSAEEYDQLPFGLIEVERDGTILHYNREEERIAKIDRTRVLGRNFFTEVAPCTQVRSFGGRFREMVDAGRTDRETLDFVFLFASGARLVTVALAYDALRERGLILVRDQS